MTDLKHRIIKANNIQIHIAEQGEGPLVLLCHGFPETWYSWRHQIPVLAEAGSPEKNAAMDCLSSTIKILMLISSIPSSWVNTHYYCTAKQKVIS